jgi:hypothetical protein
VSSLGNQEVSKPVMIAIIALAVLIIGFVGWYFMMRPQEYPGYKAPPGGAATGGPGAPGMIPGQEPGRVYPRTTPQ